MSQYDYEAGTLAVSVGQAQKDRGGTYHKTITIDFSQPPLGGTAWSSGDTAKLFFIPAGTIVEAVSTRVITAEGATLTIGLGDSGSATQYLATDNMNAAANTVVISNVSQAGSVQKAYTAADYLLMTLNNNAKAGKVVITVAMIDMSGAL